MGVGYTALLYSYKAVGIAVSKDNVATYHRTEVIVAILIKGLVGPSDAPGWTSNGRTG